LSASSKVSGAEASARGTGGSPSRLRAMCSDVSPSTSSLLMSLLHVAASYRERMVSTTAAWPWWTAECRAVWPRLSHWSGTARPSSRSSLTQGTCPFKLAKSKGENPSSFLTSTRWRALQIKNQGYVHIVQSQFFSLHQQDKFERVFLIIKNEKCLALEDLNNSSLNIGQPNDYWLGCKI
jgi:hypothetical protein